MRPPRPEQQFGSRNGIAVPSIPAKVRGPSWVDSIALRKSIKLECYVNAVDLKASSRKFRCVATRRNSLRQVLATNLRLLRNESGWSQEDLAAEAGLHRTFVGAVERAERNISLDNIEKLAVALRVEPWTLLKR